MPLHRVRAMNDYRALYQWSITEPEAFWQNEAQRLDWFHPPQQTMNTDIHEVSFSWFAGGRLNASYNCIDRHLKTQADKVAIVWAKNEPGAYVSITYRQLSREVGRIANVLKSLGIRKGDTVCLYMPMIPELAYTMLACSRIGAIHSVVFAGFSAEALRDRILDAHSKVVVTANVALRGSKTIDLKHIVDHAVEGLSFVETVLVARRTEAETPMQAGRDQWLADAVAKQRPVCAAEWMDAEDPLFILYTSGSTGKPKGVLHTTGGYLCYALSTFNYVFDLRSDDIHFCTADLGWITGHSYILYAPLAAGITTVLFESIPTFPDASRYWQVCDDVRATICYTAPTALRTLMREGDAPVKASRRDSLRILGTVGEPINPEVWRWYSEVVGEGRCPIVDTWWQTETGGILISPLAGVTPTKPGSATLPMFGVKPVLVDDQGKVLSENAVNGNLCLALAWPGMARTLYGDHSRFEKTYFRTFENLYFTGDGCRRDEDGYYWITGRVDDVLNVSGHRIGTAEVESALVAHEWVAEAAVVGYPHDIKGQGICAWVHTLPLPDDFSEEELVGALKLQVRHAIGAIATPDRILIVQGLPKTRSGKIMRRILRKIAEGQTDSLGDLSTLADPSVVEDLIRIAL